MHTLEREKYLSHLQESEKALLDAVTNLTDEQFIAKPTTDQWSIAEVIEHVIKVETGVIDYLKNFGASTEKLDNPPNNEEILQRSQNRTTKVTAPKLFTPSGLFKDKAKAIATFQKTRQTTEDFVQNTTLDLKAVSFPHQRFGLLNGENWLMFIAGHCLRHVQQIELLKENQ